jgi:hypothetical protein
VSPDINPLASLAAPSFLRLSVLVHRDAAAFLAPDEGVAFLIGPLEGLAMRVDPRVLIAVAFGEICVYRRFEFLDALELQGTAAWVFLVGHQQYT